MPIADCRVPIADLPSAECRMPIVDCWVPSAECRWPIADCRLPIAECRVPNCRDAAVLALRSHCHLLAIGKARVSAVWGAGLAGIAKVLLRCCKLRNAGDATMLCYGAMEELAC